MLLTQASGLLCILVFPPQAPESTSDPGGHGCILLNLPEDKPGLLLAVRA